MSSIKILHISDIHLPTDTKEKQRFLTIKERFMKILALNTGISKYANNLPINHIFLSGDIFYKGRQSDEDIKIIISFLDDVMSTSGITDKSYVHLVPGNHDLDHSKDKDLSEIFLNFDEKSAENKVLLNSRFTPFWKLTKAFYGDINPWNNANRAHTYKIINDLAIVYINSELLSRKTGEDDTFGISTTGSYVLKSTKTNFCQTEIIEILNTLGSEVTTVLFLAHHPPCNETELADLRRFINNHTEKKYHWFCGHMHSDRIIPCDYMNTYQSGSLFGINHTIPDFTIHELNGQFPPQRSAFRFLSHLNNGDKDGIGGWKQVYLFPDSLTPLGDTETI
jgi:predicted MPP superfamily phosphohydrolase